jgi:hypothetical protein
VSTGSTPLSTVLIAMLLGGAGTFTLVTSGQSVARRLSTRRALRTPVQ